MYANWPITGLRRTRRKRRHRESIAGRHPGYGL
jgi:hypothetical protein